MKKHNKNGQKPLVPNILSLGIINPCFRAAPCQGAQNVYESEGAQSCYRP